MPIDTIVEDPESLQTVKEIEDRISTIRAYAATHGGDAGVIKIQRRLFPPLYLIVNKKEADELLTRKVTSEPRVPEWGEKFYSITDYERLKAKLLEKEQ